ncbi:MAG: type II toxin-antitoxin system prevent-host-death family antitoxin [Candidatus Binataceae bacterium]
MECSYYGYMKVARIAELKNNLSRYLEHVRAGEPVLVLDRNLPVARIVPPERASPASPGDDERLSRLERKGLIRRGRGGLEGWLKHRRLVRVPRSVLASLLEERKSGR